jgi:hypothetical protein
LAEALDRFAEFSAKWEKRYPAASARDGSNNRERSYAEYLTDPVFKIPEAKDNLQLIDEKG